MKSLPDAIQLRAQIIRHLEEANSECNPTDRQSLLTFMVAGGGFAGVETVAALNDFVREALPFYPNLCEGMLRVMLVHSGPVILPELGESLGRYTQKVLGERGVEIRLNTRVKSMTENNVFLAHDVPIPCRTLVWTAGTVPSPTHCFASLRKGTRPDTCERILASSRLARCLGRGGLCVCARHQKSGEISSANGATCHTRRQGCGAKYRGCTLRSSSSIIFIQDHRVAGLDRSSDGRGADSWFQFFRLLRLVDVADDLPEQTTGPG